MTTLLTHPFHVLLVAMVLTRLVRLARSSASPEPEVALTAAHGPAA
jgi:hypothetical protein